VKIVGIIQARMASTRLPGKVPKLLCGKSVPAHVISRVVYHEDASYPQEDITWYLLAKSSQTRKARRS
jgi:spore coat polysaccharide biosynthesis protein SpsF (cytidylyltransferase family)